ncbi:MAG: hypothetical protein ACK4Q5_08975 [Saprospiraceae bacterium]
MNRTARFSICTLALCFLSATLLGQLSNLRSKTLDARRPAQPLDSLTVAAPLVAVFDSTSAQSIDFQFFKLQNNLLLTDTARLRAAFPGCSKIQITYRVLPFDLGAAVRRLDTAAIRQTRPGGEEYIGFDYAPFEPQRPIWQTSGLNTSGAYVRGLSFGNAQNLVFNSNLNLQLDGKLGPDIGIRAAISDNSVPLQPDGTTRQLKEFDRIFIELRRKDATLAAGDIDLANPLDAGYFLRYFKRVQGVSVSHFVSRVSTKTLPETRNSKLETRATAAISRGKFARQIIAGQEGNQGPYRLQGTEGEQFIIVLAGTEKVYLDGQLLRRGLTDDYVMDYNLGELTFTPRRLITKDSRLIVEFEYAVQAYLRSSLAADVAWQLRRARVHLSMYSEQDGRTSGAAQDLSPAERQALALAGDDLQNARASGVDTLAAADPNRVLYQYVDTLFCGQPVRVLAYSTDAENARYAARFSQVPQGTGNYVQVATAANGRVFRWVAPDPTTCQPQGNFEPIVRLVAPELKQMTTLGADFQAFKNGNITAEAALSQRDLNRFSPIGNADNAGAAAFVGLRQQVLSPEKTRGWLGQLTANYEFAGRNFQPLNPYRPAEFVRDWNTDPAAEAAAQHLAKGGFLLQRQTADGGRETVDGSAARRASLRYEFGTFVRDGFYDGRRHFAQAEFARDGWAFFSETNLLQADGTTERSRFSRPKIDLTKTVYGGLAPPSPPKGGAALTDSLPQLPLQGAGGAKPKILTLGFHFEREKNERFAAGADTLNRAAFWYDLGKLFFQTPENQGRWQWGGYVSRRKDFFPTGQFFTQNTTADEANLNGAWKPYARINKSTNQQITWNLTTRNLKILADELTDLAPQRTYLGRVDYSFSGWKNAVALTTGYEIGSGQNPKTEFTYVLVNPGEGQYAWVDRNRDSVLQVDEMEVAVFQDQANYIRVAVTTPDFVRTNNVGLNQSLRLEPRLAWHGRKGWRSWAGRFSAQSNVQISRRTLAGAGGASAWNPFDLAVADSALVTVSSGVRNALIFNRANPKWDVSLTQTDNRNRLALTTGFESRRVADWTAHGRVNLARKFSAEADATAGQKTSAHDVFQTRNYEIGYWKLMPTLTWLPGRQFRLALKMRGQRSENSPELGGETARQTDFSAETTWNPPGKTNATTGFRAATSLRAKATFADVKFDGQANSVVGYAMLEGLQNGQNFLWSLSLDRQLTKDIQLNISYEGRKTGAALRPIHVGRAQVRAVF